MLFVLLHLSFCRKFLDFTGRNDIQDLEILTASGSTTEIHVKNGTGSFLDDFRPRDNFILEVKAKNSDGNIVSYGSFKNGDRLYGVIFKTKNYSLIFKNTDEFALNLKIYFARDIREIKFFYPEFETYDKLDSPFIIYNYQSNSIMISLILLFSLVAFYIFLTFACKDTGKNYCQCCKKSKVSKTA